MANILSPILIVRLSDLFCGNGLDPDHVAKEFHEEAVQIGLGPLRMQEENPLHVTGRGGERGSFHNAHPRKVIGNLLRGIFNCSGAKFSKSLVKIQNLNMLMGGRCGGPFTTPTHAR